jgi:hypothetical protein
MKALAVNDIEAADVPARHGHTLAARSLARRAFAPGVAGHTARCPRLDGVNVLAMGSVYLCGIRTGNVARRAG